MIIQIQDLYINVERINYYKYSKTEIREWLLIWFSGDNRIFLDMSEEEVTRHCEGIKNIMNNSDT